MRNKINKLFSIFNKVANSNMGFLLFVFATFIFVFLNILTKNIILGIFYLILNLFFYFFSSTKKALLYIYMHYPLARVLKIGYISTSLLTVNILLFCLIIFVKFFKQDFQKININKLLIIFFFGLYFVVTFSASLFNNKGFQFSQLISYYLYLFFPILCSVSPDVKKEINPVANLILLFLSYFLGIIFTIIFYYLVPDGNELLLSSGVNVFDMNTYGVRFSPLCDDPNYGTSLILLTGCLFICAKKTAKQSLVGYALLCPSLLLSLFSLSKMFILCLGIIILFQICRIVVLNKTILMAMVFLSLFFAGLIFFLSTPYGNTFLIRLIGSTDGIDLNRITSGRTDLLGEYSSYILSNPLVLLFGKGPLFSDLDYFSNGEHNTFTYNILGSGLIGISFILICFYLMLKERRDKLKTIPISFSFISFLICMFVCCMSLCINPSTVFPLVVMSAQSISFATKEKFDKTLDRNEKKGHVCTEENTFKINL